MSNYTILGRYLITSANEAPKAGYGVRIIGNRIADIDSNENLKKRSIGSSLIDATDKIIMPGFINTHMHMYAMLAQGMPTNNIRTDLYYDLIDSWWPKIEDQMDHEAIRVSAALAVMSSIRSGVTTICDVMEAPYALPGCLEVAGKVLDEAGMRAILSFEASERVSEKYGQLGLEENASFIRNHPTGRSRISGMMSVHTTFSGSLPFLKKGRQLAVKLGSFIHMHLSESQYEALHCLRNYCMLPFEVYEAIGFLGKDVLASQCVHVRPREIPIMARHGVNVSHQPMSNASSGRGIAPVTDFLANGIPVGIGTDGNCRNHFEVLRSAFLIQRAHLLDGTVVPPNTLFDMATATGARAIGMDDTGTLKKGNLADMILLESNFSMPVTLNNLISLVINFRDPQDVNTVIIDGELVMKDRKLVTMDEEQVRTDAQAIAQRVWKKGNTN